MTPVTITEDAIARAFRARAAHIAANAATMTPKAVRRMLEGDLNVDAHALDAHKRAISALLEALMAPKDDEEEEDDDEDDDDEAEEEEEEEGSDDDEEEKTERERKRAKTSTTARTTSTKTTTTMSGDVAKYRDACKRAGITAFQGVLMRTTDEKARIDAMSALLRERGLSVSSAPSEFERVKAKIEMERDMDGIDTSNIVTGGRRRTAAYGTTNYAQLEASSDDDDDDDDDDGHSDSDDEKPQAAAKKGNKVLDSSSEDDE